MKNLIFALIVFVGIETKAQVLLEPNIGFQFGTHEFSQTLSGSEQNRDGTTSGFGIGARAGYKYTMFWGALDLLYSAPSMTADTAMINSIDVTSSTQNIALDWSGSNFQLGITAGVDLVMGIRGWIGYYFLNYITLDDQYETEMSGGAFKIGAGYKIMPLVSVNMEYIISSFTGDTQSGGIPQFMTDTAELKHNAFYLNVSVPYELGLNL